MNIYVGNISYNMTPQEIKDLFLPFGNVVNVKIINDKQSGRSKGYAFVEMDNDETALKAIESLNDTQIKGRNIKVSNAHRKTEEPQKA
jgi:RNA recognition motif-containing protein